MLSCAVVIVLVLGCFAANEPTDFDYNDHGKDWQRCPKDGSNQSPILLPQKQKIQSELNSYLFSNYEEKDGIANYLNTTIYINTTTDFGSSYTKIINGESIPFKATQIRFRMHSEHKTADGYYPLQVQIFHVQLYATQRNRRLAIGLFFDVEGDKPNQFLQNVIDGYQDGNSQSNIKLNLGNFLGENNIDDFWFYLGSSTIPPCSNGKVNWLVSKKIFKMTKTQKDKLQFILVQNNTGNWRDIQPFNDQIGYHHLVPIEQF